MKTTAALVLTLAANLAISAGALAYPTGDDPQATHNGLTYHFTNGGDRARFLDLSERYAPRYGGFCGPGSRAALVVAAPNPAGKGEVLAVKAERPLRQADAIWARILAQAPANTALC